MQQQHILAAILALLISGTLSATDMAIMSDHLRCVSNAHMYRLASVLADAYKLPASTRDDLADITDDDLAFLNHCARCLPLGSARPMFARGEGRAIIITHHD